MAFKGLITKARAGNAAACMNCGEPLHPKRGSRRQRYCGSACRQSAFRSNKWAARYKTADPLRSVPNNDGKSIVCEGHFGDRGSRISAPAMVLERELTSGRHWAPVTSPDGVVCLVASLGAAP